jgi:hypothetical protein
MEAISDRSGCLARTVIWPPLSSTASALASWKGASARRRVRTRVWYSEHRWVDTWEQPLWSVWLAAMAELDDPVVVELPLRGEWSVEWTPASRIPSHGTDLLGQRYAYDLVRADHRPGFHLHPAGTLRWLLIGGRTRDCYGWGQPVLAAFDGVIVQAVDGVPERQWLHVVRESWLGAAQHVGVRAARAGSRPACRQPCDRGSRRLVRAVRAPRAGQRRGHRRPAGPRRRGARTCGPHWELDRPHLHFQLMGSADPLQARGIPCAFAAYLVERDGRWQRVERGIPHRRQRICSVS